MIQMLRKFYGNSGLVEMVQSFDHGYYLLVKSIQELREKKEGLVTVGIGGPSGSGKTRYIWVLDDEEVDATAII